MDFEKALTSSAILLAATGFAGLLLAGSIPIWLTALTLTVLLVAILNLTGSRIVGRLGRPGSTFVWNALLIGALVFFLVDLTMISKDLLRAGIHFLAVLLNVKLMTLNDRRDYRHLYAISLMSVVASAALTTDLWYASVFALYLLAAIWSLLLYHFTDRTTLLTDQSAAAAAPHSCPADSNHIITGQFFKLTARIALLTFAVTLIIFFFLPRISVGILQKPRGEGLRTTGFSERVDLGMIGSVKEDPQIVMRVEVSEQPAAGGERLYLRGLAFDHYNGRSWSSGRRQRRNLSPAADGTFLVRAPGIRNAAAGSTALRQDILLEALDTSVLFAAPFPESISGELVAVQADGMTGLHFPYPSASRIRYSVLSREHRLMPEEQTSGAVDYAAAIRERYLQLPAESDRVRELARRVTDSVNPIHEKTTAVLHHLLSNYTYSLDADTAVSNHPIDEFLFSRKTGYCEHYATAMVLMLRTIGIPSRLVTGFLATEWNEFGSYYTVRQRDAHAWVEVYYPQSGWITMDPTPPNTAAFTPSAWVAVQRLSESLRLHWDRLFIRYSSRDQLAVVHSLQETSGSARQVLSEWTVGLGHSFIQSVSLLRERAGKTLGFGLFWLLVLGSGMGVVALIAVTSGRWSYRRSGERPAIRGQQHIVQLYKKTLQLAAARGLHISPSTTPTELLRLVTEQWTEAGPTVNRLTALYCRGRFSAASLSGEELSQALQDHGLLSRLSRRPE